MLALALSKFVISVILTLAYSAVGASVTGDITDAFLGSIWVLLAAFSPLAVLRFAHFAGDQIGAANTSGVAGAWGNARQAGHLGKVGAGAVGGVVGGAAGWIAGRAGSSRSAPPKTPAAAVGGSGSPTTQQASPAGSPTTATGVGSGSPSGSTAATPPASGDPAGLGGGFGTTPSTNARSRSPEAPDPQVQPAMDAYLSDAAQNRSAVVTPAAAAAHLGVPQTQADRMFLQYEAGGVLGPQQPGGARRVLAAPTTTGATQ